jgi:hypothetical protein
LQQQRTETGLMGLAWKMVVKEERAEHFVRNHRTVGRGLPYGQRPAIQLFRTQTGQEDHGWHQPD